MISFPPEKSIRESYLAQRRLAQLHRWIAHQLDSRSDSTDLVISSPNYCLDGQSTTLDHLSDAVATQVSSRLSLNGETWPNPCLSESDQDDAAVLSAEFDDKELPLIESVSFKSTTQVPQANPSAIPHRILALKHRWHAIVEAPIKKPADLEALIAPSFEMHWGYGGLSGFEALANWLTQSAASMDAARHDIDSFTWVSTDTNTYEARFDFTWYGYSSELEPMHAASRHTWQIEDKPEERYPRLRQMSVEFLTPFHTVSGANHD